MTVEFKSSETKENLMRAFAGESQARNRYTFVAEQAQKNNFHVVAAVFTYTANQEKEHAEVFYQHLSELAGESIQIEGGYPIDISRDLTKLLRMAQHNEYEEHDDVYQKFAEKAKEEGFLAVEHSFRLIAEIEKVHGDRFGRLAEWMEENRLFVSEVETKWMCLNCGYILDGKEAPEQCPVCSHNKGFFIRFEFSPYEQ